MVCVLGRFKITIDSSSTYIYIVFLNCVCQELLFALLNSTLRVSWGAWVAQWVKPLPLAQVMIPASWDRAPHQALCSAGSLLPPLSLPASLPTCDLSVK